MLKSQQLRANSQKLNQGGLTSIVVVFVLVTLMTLIGIGFTKVMNRSLQSSAASQQASAANYAAQSGVNDVLSYLKTQPATSATKCDDLIKTGAPLATAAKISSDGSTAYTCVLVNPTPASLFYQGISPYKSQIIKVTTSAQLASLLFSWQSTNRAHNQFVAAAAGQPLYDEKTWSDKNYAPLLRLTLYPIPANGDLSGVQASSKTFFLYPQTGGSNTLAYSASGDIAQVDCSSKNIGSFSGSADYDCNVVINSLPSAAYFYARFTPYYDQATVKIIGNDASGQAVQFINVQSVVDVTAKSGGATKRLQARVDTSAASGAVVFNISADSDIAPENALRSAFTICKRLIVQNPGPLVFIDPASATNCTQGTQLIDEQQKPAVTTSAATSVTATTATLNGTVNPNGVNVLTCVFKYGTSSSYGSTRDCASLPAAGSAAVDVSAPVTDLSQGTLYHFQLCATNIANSKDRSISCGADVTFTAPPTVTVSVSRSTINTGEKSTISWISTGITTSCTLGDQWAGFSTAPSGSHEDTFNTAGTFTYSATCTGPGGDSPSSSATVTVTTPPPPPAPQVVIREFKFNGYSGQMASFTYDELNGSNCSITMNYSNPGGSESQSFVARPSSGGVAYDPTNYPYYSTEIYPGRSATATLTCTAGGGAIPGSKDTEVLAFRSPSVTITNVTAFFTVVQFKIYGSCQQDGQPGHNYMVCFSWQASPTEPGDSIGDCNAGGSSNGRPYYTTDDLASNITSTRIGSSSPIYNIYVRCYSVFGAKNGTPGTTSNPVTSYASPDTQGGGGGSPSAPSPPPSATPAPAPAPVISPAPAPPQWWEVPWWWWL